MGNSIEDNINKIFKEIPDSVKVVGAAKSQSPLAVKKAVEAGLEIIGENYIKDAKEVYHRIKDKAQLHFIGMPDKAKHDLLRRKNLKRFDMIETINSVEIAEELNDMCAKIDKVMPILIEINSGEEKQKAGVLPDDTIEVVKEISKLKNIKVKGLMTMGSTPHQSMEDPKDRERAKKCFKRTKELFDKIRELDISNVEMKYLSMGMSNSYQIAIKEGANMIRVGSKIFGRRN